MTPKKSIAIISRTKGGDYIVDIDGRASVADDLADAHAQIHATGTSTIRYRIPMADIVAYEKGRRAFRLR